MNANEAYKIATSSQTIEAMKRTVMAMIRAASSSGKTSVRVGAFGMSISVLETVRSELLGKGYKAELRTDENGIHLDIDWSHAHE